MRKLPAERPPRQPRGDRGHHRGDIEASGIDFLAAAGAVKRQPGQQHAAGFLAGRLLPVVRGIREEGRALLGRARVGEKPGHEGLDGRGKKNGVDGGQEKAVGPAGHDAAAAGNHASAGERLAKGLLLPLAKHRLAVLGELLADRPVKGADHGIGVGSGEARRQ